MFNITRRYLQLRTGFGYMEPHDFSGTRHTSILNVIQLHCCIQFLSTTLISKVKKTVSRSIKPELLKKIIYIYIFI